MTDTNHLLLDQKRTASLIANLAALRAAPASSHFTVTDLKVRLELMESFWTELSERDVVLQRSSDSLKERTYFKKKMYDTTLSSYLTTKACMKERFHS